MASKVLAYIAFATALYFVPNVLGANTLSHTNGQFIWKLYKTFNVPFQDIRFGQSVQFGFVTTATNLNLLNPNPPQFGGGLLSRNSNYLAETPARFYNNNGIYNDIDNGRYDLVHVEDQLAQAFTNRMMTQNPLITNGDVYIFTYYSPCNDCATILANLANNFLYLNFHIGYLEEYGNTLPRSNIILSPRNIFVGRVNDPGSCIIPPRSHYKRNANERTIICEECNEPLGMEDKRITNSQITATDYYSWIDPYDITTSIYLPEKARLHSNDLAWATHNRDTDQYIQISLPEVQFVSGVITQGHSDAWVTSYRVEYTKDDRNWQFILAERQQKIFTANTDADTPVTNNFKEIVQVKSIRIRPQSWNHWIHLRLELLGCATDEVVIGDGVDEETNPHNGDLRRLISIEWSDWEPWSACSVTCGGGTETRTRHCFNPITEHGDVNCVGNSMSTRECNTESCVGRGTLALEPCDGLLPCPTEAPAGSEDCADDEDVDCEFSGDGSGSPPDPCSVFEDDYYFALCKGGAIDPSDVLGNEDLHPCSLSGGIYSYILCLQGNIDPTDVPGNKDPKPSGAPAGSGDCTDDEDADCEFSGDGSGSAPDPCSVFEENYYFALCKEGAIDPPDVPGNEDPHPCSLYGGIYSYILCLQGNIDPLDVPGNEDPIPSGAPAGSGDCADDEDADCEFSGDGYGSAPDPCSVFEDSYSYALCKEGTIDPPDVPGNEGGPAPEPDNNAFDYSL